MNICENCCQIKINGVNLNVKCLCNGGNISKKYLGLVKGCVVFTDNIRCKKECHSNGICPAHYIIKE